MEITNDTGVTVLDARSNVDIAFAAIFLVLLIIITVSGNIAVIIAIFINRHLREEKSSLLIANLAVTDLTSGVTVMVSSLFSLVDGRWIFGQGMCSFICAVNYCLIITSMLTLCFISFDRYQAIIYPLTYISWISTQKVVCAIAYAWFQGLIFSVVPVILQWVQYDYWEVVCAIQWQKEKQEALYYVVTAFAFCFLIPGIALAINYFLILNEVKKKLTSVTPSNNNVTTYSASRKAVNSLLVVVLAYFVCMAPFSVTKLIKVIVSDADFVPGRINTAASLIAFCSSAVNPLVYGLFRKDFRKSYRKIFRKLLHPILDQSSNESSE